MGYRGRPTDQMIQSSTAAKTRSPELVDNASMRIAGMTKTAATGTGTSNRR
jgi:hypothetical protein